MAAKNKFRKNPKTNFKDLDDLKKKEAREQAEELREAIEFHNHKYYVENDPVISDNKFDKLFKRLQEIEEKYPDLQKKNSPTKKVGAPPLDELKKKKHKKTLLSLKSDKEEDEIKDFYEDMKEETGRGKNMFVLEPKWDGLSVEIFYKNGEFEYAATRGDGETGEDISENVKTINAVPLKVIKKKMLPDELSLRGEVILPKDDFRKMNKERIEKNKDAFANPRNAAAGIVRQLNPAKAAEAPLDIFFYEIIHSSKNGRDTHWDTIKDLKKWGFKVSDMNKQAGNFSDIVKYKNRLTKKRDDLNYEIDGIVIKVNDLELREDLGVRERNPKWAMAWKFEPKKEKTELLDIIVQVGRTGMLTPVAQLEPVEVDGVTISRATLHNEDEVHKKDVRKGDKVKVQRAGDVIPEVVEVVSKKKKRSKEFNMPKKCPVCGTGVVKENVYYFCPAGLTCEAQLKGQLEHFASKLAMDIDHLGEKVIEQLVEREMVTGVHELYDLTKDDLKKLEGFADKSAENLMDSIEGSKKIRLDRFIYALGIRHVGRHTAKQLARKYGKLKAFLNTGKKELKKIEDIGPEVAESINNYLKNDKNRDMIKKLQKKGVKIKNMKKRKDRKLEGKRFVFTGSLSNFTRSEAKEEVELLGAEASSSVSSNTDYLVRGEDPGQKLNDAKENNVKILEEDDFIKMLNN